MRHTQDAVLDATRDCLLAVGVRRTTLTDVARRAGVSRMTLYRRWPDVASLVGDLMTREFGGLLEDTRPPAGESATARTLLVTHVATAVSALRANPVFRKIIDVDPELLLPYLLHRAGASQSMALSVLLEYLAGGQHDGSIRAGDPQRLAGAVMLCMQSFALSAQVFGGDDRELAGELRRVLDGYLRKRDP
jgi:AcrR family transcriptional regulator